MSMTYESEAPMTATSVAAEPCRDAACAGQYEPTRRPLVQRHHGALAIVEDVPLLRCPICGDEKMSFATAERLDRIATDPPLAVGAAPIYRFDEGGDD